MRRRNARSDSERAVVADSALLNLGDAGRVGEDQLECAGARRAEVTGFGVERSAVVECAGALAVGEEGFPDVPEADFLVVAEGFDRRILAHTLTCPGAEQRCERRQCGMQFHHSASLGVN